MPRTKSVYVCDSCGNDSPKWEGRCPSCGQWNTLAEVHVDSGPARRRSPKRPGAMSPVELSEVPAGRLPRLELSSVEVNRVLGGGVVPGSVVLIAGDPGIGKSTLVLRILSDVAAGPGTALYITGEESNAQVKMRADRLGVSGKGVHLLQATSLAQVLDQLDATRPALAVVDSIQTLYDDSSQSSAGTVAQIRECTRALMEWAKSNDVPMVLTGHVTKGGDIAGPRALEHMVDVVLYLEGDPVSSWRLLRSIKNRYGSTNEVGVLEMMAHGLVDVPDPSREFLSERREGAVGSVVVPTMEGSRPLLVEVQALTNPSQLPVPRRVATGIDFNRLLMVCAVLSRRVGVSLANQDVVVNVTGGLKISEPAADLAVALAIVSCLRNAPVRAQLAAMGEIGLSGEVRSVPQLPRRLAEAARLGLRQAIVPATRGDMSDGAEGLELARVRTLAEAIRAALPRSVGGAGRTTEPAAMRDDGD